MIDPAGDDDLIEPGDDVPPARTAGRSARLQFLVGVALALSATAIALLVAALIRGSDSGPVIDVPTWSAWHPAAHDRATATRQIAAHFAPRYRADGGRRLVDVSGGPLRFAGVPLTIALRDRSGAVQLVKDPRSTLFRLCGPFPACTANAGRPSIPLHLLLRREALELALYSFRYTDADQVVVLLPPRAHSTTALTGQALYFRRAFVQSALDKPLAATLTDDPPLPSTALQAADTLTVQHATIPALFDFALPQPGQPHKNLLVLSEIPTSQLAPPGTPVPVVPSAGRQV